MRGRPLKDLAVGDNAELTRVATAGDVAEFIDSIGDHNPIHRDYEYAASTRFEKPIVPGMWTAALISAVLGTRLPGPGCVYVGQGDRVHPARLLRRPHHRAGRGRGVRDRAEPGAG